MYNTPYPRNINTLQQRWEISSFWMEEVKDDDKHDVN